jgi:hypothetical protein
VKRIDDKPLTFPVGDKEYTIPPVGWDCGLKLVGYFDLEPAKLAKLRFKSEDLFRLAMSEAVWEQMVADGVASHVMFRAGLASLAHFQALARGTTAEEALAIAEAVWESSVDPEAVAAAMAANRSQQDADSTTSRSTAAAGSSTRRRASTSGTTSRPRKPRAPRSTPAKS